MVVRFILFNYTTMSYPTYSDLELEIQNLEEENKKLNENIKWYEKEEDRLREEIRFKNNRIKELELCNLNLQTWIDNKEKVNKQLREDLGKLVMKE